MEVSPPATFFTLSPATIKVWHEMQLQTVSLTVAINSIKEERMSEVPVAQPVPKALKSTLNPPNGKEENPLYPAPKPIKSTLNLPNGKEENTLDSAPKPLGQQHGVEIRTGIGNAIGNHRDSAW